MRCVIANYPRGGIPKSALNCSGDDVPTSPMLLKSDIERRAVKPYFCRLDASPVGDLRLDDMPLVLMTPEELETELVEIRHRLRLPAKVPTHAAPDLDEEAWNQLILAAIGCLYPALQISETSTAAEDVHEAPSPLTTNDRLALGHRLHRLVVGVRKARDALDATGPLTGCLVPRAPASRVAYLLETCAVPMAWVRVLYVSPF